jgi:hypothetical protein
MALDLKLTTISSFQYLDVQAPGVVFFMVLSYLEQGLFGGLGMVI